jgi:exoribonuclease R
MSIYKIHINDRAYQTWTIYHTDSLLETTLDICPVTQKLFSNDVFSINENNKVSIIHSSIRSSKLIPCVLMLNGNKTHGRSSNGKLLYKCVPDDKRLPAFLVPYEMKNIGFNKNYSNMYVTINYSNWNEKHPCGTMSQVIGTVDLLDNFYEYQLYCKSLNASIQKFTKDTVQKLKYSQPHNDFIDKMCSTYPTILDRTDQTIWKIFSIDPVGSVDFDDAFSIKSLDNGNFQLSIYISNVTIWMDYLNLWDSFTRRISTIYLPDKKRPMLPTILSDCLCSLQENQSRIAFVLDVIIDEKYNIVDTQYSNCKINVYKNYRYEERSLLSDLNYQLLFNITTELSIHNKHRHKMRNSHDVVSYLMILMNYNSAHKLLEHRNGIFRSTIINKTVDVPNNLPEELQKFITMWNSTSGQYLDINSLPLDYDISHKMLELDAYLHITSPIRRLVDLLNIIKIQQNMRLVKLSENAYTFYNNWLNEVDYINTTMRAIRKVQNDCTLLHICANNPTLMDDHFTGYVFDKLIRSDGLYQYIVYLPNVKMVSKITMRENMDNYEVRKYKMFLFQDEDNLKKKIRLQLVA